MLSFHFSGGAGEMTESQMLAAGMVGKQIRFTFSEEWQDLRKVAIYRAGDITVSTVDVQEVDIIPAQVLAEPLQRLYVGVCGISEDGTVVIPTGFVEGPFIHISATLAEDPDFDPENTFWIRLEEAMGELAELTTGEKSSLVGAINELVAQKNGDFLKNVEISQSFDPETDTHYTALRVYRERLDGKIQYPLVYAPGAAVSPKDLAAEGWPLVINAGIFHMDTGKADGLVIQEGQCIQEGAAVTSAGCMPLTVDFQGDLSAAAADARAEDLPGVLSAVCGFMPIIRDHVAIPQENWNDVANYTQRAQRQIIGQYENGDYAIVTCDGRGFGASQGWTMGDAQRICMAMGMKFAYNLDGGGSTGTVLDKKQFNTVYEGETGRKVPTFILFNGGTRLGAEKEAAFTALEYLQVPSGAYIRTDIPETKVFSLEYKAVNLDWTPPKGHVMSGMNTFYTFLKGSYNEGEQLLVSNFKGSAPADLTVDVPFSQAYTIRNEYSGGNMTVKLNGAALYTSPVGTAADSSIQYHLFAYGGNPTADRYWFHGRIYYLKLWDEQGILQHHLIPVRRNDGVCGLYDKVSGAFFTSSTQVAFEGA